MFKSLFKVPIPSVPVGSVIYAIGDVHGRADLLEQAFEKIEKDRSLRSFDTCYEVYLGDYVDRGPASKGALDLLIARTKNPGVVALRGNHEDVMLGTLEHPDALEKWRSVGGAETMMSYGLSGDLGKSRVSELELFANWLDVVPESHRTFLAGLNHSISIGDYFFAHAGVRPGISLEQQKPRDLMWIREEFLKSNKWHGKYIVHGHTPTERPDLRLNRMGIDTGAYITGKLTCLKLFESEKVFI